MNPAASPERTKNCFLESMCKESPELWVVRQDISLAPLWLTERANSILGVQINVRSIGRQTACSRSRGLLPPDSSIRPGIDNIRLIGWALLLINVRPRPMSDPTYFEDFNAGPGGWLGWMAGGGGPRVLEIHDSIATVRSPWGVDINHAPPGAGYLHLLYVLFTEPADSPRHVQFEPLAGTSRFARGDYPRNFLNSRLSIRMRGQLAARGAQLLLLIQAQVGEIRTNYVLSGQPISIRPEWTETTLRLSADPGQWTCLGTRGPGADCACYGEAPVEGALQNLNVNLILVLFPLRIEPLAALPDPTDVHRLRAGIDYPIDRQYLPSGEVSLDWVKVEYAD